MPVARLEKSKLKVAFFNRTTEFLIGEPEEGKIPIYKSQGHLYGDLSQWSYYSIYDPQLTKKSKYYLEFKQWLRENMNNLPV